MPQRRRTPTFEHSLAIAASPSRVLAAFFDPAALATWWQAKRSLTTPRSLGVYAVEWDVTEFRDEVLGPLGGVFYGTVIEHVPGMRFFLGGAYWLPPEGEPIGPMALHVYCAVDEGVTHLHVAQSGYEESLRWSRYYSIITDGWKPSLARLKEYVEGDLTISPEADASPQSSDPDR